MVRLLDDSQKEKYDFVRTTLSSLLREVLRNDHYRADYYVDEQGFEWVEISFDNEYSIRKINVSADSLLALTRDVLRTF